ncbi:hypothetical protein E6C27_scaffold274G004710 [Cucumis melo var. makuwa]|uniref:Uncharacterized protein n=1 Tax=Cucumis melo var. makuwa TaxID=1194695 RepID=A0A5A7USL3_CUCMM|nr:hypothetical protein E6C27_scaffold274G004710 [Cucumis melo var. makuwa]
MQPVACSAAAVAAISSNRSAASGASPPPFEVAPLHRSQTVRASRHLKLRRALSPSSSARRSSATRLQPLKARAPRLSRRPNPKPTRATNILDQLTLERWISSVRAQALQPRPWEFRRLGERVVTARTGRVISSPSVLGILLGITKDQLVPTGAHVARVRGRANSEVEAEVGTRASWRVTRSDRGGP